MNARKITFYIVLALVSALMAFSGGSKALWVEGVQKAMEHSPLTEGFVRFIGIMEVLGAIGLWLPKTRIPAAICLLTIMFGAIGTHVGMNDAKGVGGAAASVVFLMLVIALDPAYKLVIQPRQAA